MSILGKRYRTSGNTSNLMEHLKSVHPFVQNDAKIAPKLDAFLSRSESYGSTSGKKSNIDEALSRRVVLDLQPFSIVENFGFKHFMRTLDPKYILRSRRFLKDVTMKNWYESSLVKLEDILNEIQYCSLTTDTRTSRVNVNYLTVTCHFIENFNIKSAVNSKMLRFPYPKINSALLKICALYWSFSRLQQNMHRFQRVFQYL